MEKGKRGTGKITIRAAVEGGEEIWGTNSKLALARL